MMRGLEAERVGYTPARVGTAQQRVRVGSLVLAPKGPSTTNMDDAFATSGPNTRSFLRVTSYQHPTCISSGLLERVGCACVRGLTREAAHLLCPL